MSKANYLPAPQLIRCQSGDVLLIRSHGIFADVVRSSLALARYPDTSNCFAVIDHSFPHGPVWALEGRPGGLGWRNADDYFHGFGHRYVLTNWQQTKKPEQRKIIVNEMRKLLSYPLESSFTQTTDCNVVASTLAAKAYNAAGLACPYIDETTIVTPADWDTFILQRYHEGH